MFQHNTTESMYPYLFVFKPQNQNPREKLRNSRPQNEVPSFSSSKLPSNVENMSVNMSSDGKLHAQQILDNIDRRKVNPEARGPDRPRYDKPSSKQEVRNQENQNKIYSGYLDKRDPPVWKHERG